MSLFVADRCGADAKILWRQLGLPSFVVLALPAYDLVEIRGRIGGRPSGRTGRMRRTSREGANGSVPGGGRRVAGALLVAVVAAAGSLAAQAPGGPVIVLDTPRGVIEIETFPVEAPKSVEHVLELVRSGFYDGQRLHLVRPDFIVQFGDPLSRDPARRMLWGRHAGANSGHPVGVAELSKKYTHLRGTVGLAHTGDAATADSQIYITLSPQPQLDGEHAVIGRVIAGDDVLGRLAVGDLIRRASVREPGQGS